MSAADDQMPIAILVIAYACRHLEYGDCRRSMLGGSSPFAHPLQD